MKNILTLYMCLLSFILFGQKGDLLIKNGTVITVTQGVKLNTDILIKNGKIQKIGQNLSDDKAKVVDATDKFVMPGIIDAHSHIAIDNVNEPTNVVTSEVNVGDAINPMDVRIYRALAGGVTSIHAMHGSANAIGGECETLKLRYGTMNPEEMRMEGAPRTIKFALGENPMRVHGEGNRIMPRTRMGVEAVFRKAFSEALLYKKEWEKYEAGLNTQQPIYSKRLQTLADIIDGKVIIQCHSYRADELIMLMEVLKDFGIKKLTFQHVNEGFKVAPEIAEFGAGASVFSDWWAYKFEVYYSTAYNAAILTKNGVTTSINSDDAGLIRHLYHEASKTQRYGALTDNEALRLITINPAIQLGIDDRVGSIELGKDGDIAIFDKHPLSIYTIPQMTIVDGVIRFDKENDPDDMRLDINPEESDPTFYLFDADRADRCMEGVSQHAFHFHNHNHKH